MPMTAVRSRSLLVSCSRVAGLLSSRMSFLANLWMLVGL